MGRLLTHSYFNGRSLYFGIAAISLICFSSKVISADGHSGIEESTSYSPSSIGILNGRGVLDDLIEQAHNKGQCKAVTEKNGTDNVPVDFLKGMGYSYVRSMCGRQGASSGQQPSPFSYGTSQNNPLDSKSVRGLLTSPPGALSKNDVLSSSHYSTGANGGSNDSNAARTYAILAALTMQESDGNIAEGIDGSKDKSLDTPEAAEAGAYQVSADSQGLLLKGSPAAKEAYKELLKSYLEPLKTAGSNLKEIERICYVSKYTGGGSKNAKKSVNPSELLQKAQKVALGGKAYQERLSNEDFQTFNQSCPAFATEYAAMIARTNLDHNGPLKRGEVKPSEGCVQMFNELSKQAQDPYICKEIGL